MTDGPTDGRFTCLVARIFENNLKKEHQTSGTTKTIQPPPPPPNPVRECPRCILITHPISPRLSQHISDRVKC